MIQSQFFRFVIVGVIVFIINAVSVELMSAQVGPIYAQLVAFPMAATIAWWLNRRYTFGCSARSRRQEWIRYIASNSIGWVVSNGVYFLLVLQSPLFYHHPFIAVAAGSVAGMFFNFYASKYFVFKKIGFKNQV